MHVRRLLFSCVGFLIAVLTCNSQVNPQRATVHIVLVDAGGRDLGAGTVESFQEETKGAQDLRTRFKDNAASNIPFGIYKLKVFTTGFYTATRRILVRQSQVWVVAQLDVGEENGPLPYNISGSVQGVSSTKDLWVRAQGLYSDVIADTRVSDTGNFELAGAPQGIYVLTTRRGNSVLDIRSLTVPPPEQKHGTTVRIRVEIKE
jgi:hypothetical protein